MIFSSTEPKAQVCFSDENVSVFCRSRCCRRYKLFCLLLQNHMVNFNQPGTEHPWTKGIQVCTKERQHPILREMNRK